MECTAGTLNADVTIKIKLKKLIWHFSNVMLAFK